MYIKTTYIILCMMRGRYSGSDMLRVVPEIRVDEVLIDQRRFRFAYHTPRHRSTPIGESIPTETKRQRQRQRQTERQRERRRETQRGRPGTAVCGEPGEDGAVQEGAEVSADATAAAGAPRQ